MKTYRVIAALLALVMLLGMFCRLQQKPRRDDRPRKSLQ